VGISHKLSGRLCIFIICFFVGIVILKKLNSAVKVSWNALQPTLTMPYSSALLWTPAFQFYRITSYIACL